MFVSVRDLNPSSPWGDVLFYPQSVTVSATAIAPVELSRVRDRLQALEQLGVEGIYDAVGLPGARLLRGWHVLGRGYRGVVVLGRWRGQRVALKLRRSDAPLGASLLPEASFLRSANRVQVGPTCWAASAACVVMDWVVGDPSELGGANRLIDWVYRKPDDPLYPDNGSVQAVLLQLADASFRLDQLGLDHGELSCVASHALIRSGAEGDAEAVLIDFGQASWARRPGNVTALVQGLLIGTSIPKALARRFILPERERAIAALRTYKQDPSPENFQRVRSLCADLEAKPL